MIYDGLWRPMTWPYWMRTSFPGAVLTLPTLPGDAGDQSSSASPHSGPPSSLHGGLLAKLAELDDTSGGRSPGLPSSTSLTSTGNRIFGNRGHSIESWNSGGPSWLSSAMPPTTSGGIFEEPPSLPAFPHSLPRGSGNADNLWPTAFGENTGSRTVTALQRDSGSDPVYGMPVPSKPAEPNPIQLAGMDIPSPGTIPSLPPLVIPGLPQWKEHFERGLQGLINEFRSSGRGRGRRKEDDDDDECLSRRNTEVDKCYQRLDDYAHQDFLQACKDRADYRWRLCIQNKGRPDPHEPRGWGPEDEEIWRNYGR